MDGDFALTLIDCLDTFVVSGPCELVFPHLLKGTTWPLQVMGDKAGFEDAVQRVIQHVKFDLDSRVQVRPVVACRCFKGGHMTT